MYYIDQKREKSQLFCHSHCIRNTQFTPMCSLFPLLVFPKENLYCGKKMCQLCLVFGT